MEPARPARKQRAVKGATPLSRGLANKAGPLFCLVRRQGPGRNRCDKVTAFE